MIRISKELILDMNLLFFSLLELNYRLLFQVQVVGTRYF